MDREKQVKTVDQYIGRFPKDVQRRLMQLRRAVRSAAPQASETLSYQMPAFKLNRSLVYFGAFKSHIGFYPTSSGVRAFKKELAAYKVTKGAVQFPMEVPIPVELVKKIVAFRVKEDSGSTANVKKKQQPKR